MITSIRLNASVKKSRLGPCAMLGTLILLFPRAVITAVHPGERERAPGAAASPARTHAGTNTTNMERASVMTSKHKEVVHVGTDVYMGWKGQTRKEREKQITGFSIDGGKVGYLRASIGMTNENAVLREVFPDSFWESGKPTRFVFDEEGYGRLTKLGAAYLLAAMAGRVIRSEKNRESEEIGRKVLEMLAGAGIRREDVSVGRNRDLRGAVMWLNSLFSFYELGMEKEREGKLPEVYISW